MASASLEHGSATTTSRFGLVPDAAFTQNRHGLQQSADGGFSSPTTRRQKWAIITANIWPTDRNQGKLNELCPEFLILPFMSQFQIVAGCLYVTIIIMAL